MEPKAHIVDSLCHEREQRCNTSRLRLVEHSRLKLRKDFDHIYSNQYWSIKICWCWKFSNMLTCKRHKIQFHREEERKSMLSGITAYPSMLHFLFVCNCPVASVFPILHILQGKSISAGFFLVHALCDDQLLPLLPAHLPHDSQHHHQHHGQVQRDQAHLLSQRETYTCRRSHLFQCCFWSCESTVCFVFPL